MTKKEKTDIVKKLALLPNEDKLAIVRALKADSAYSALWDMDQYLRGQVKYGEQSEEAKSALNAARTVLHDLLTSNGIDLETEYL